MKLSNNSSPFERAYAAWFQRYEVERRRRRKRKGARLEHFPGPPASPADIAAAVDAIGARRVLAVLEIHRSTLARWLAGSSVIPRPTWLILSLLADGRLPGMSDDWRDWRFDGDRLCLTGTRIAYTPRELAGWPYQQAHAAALARRVAELEIRLDHLLSIGRFEAANAAYFTA